MLTYVYIIIKYRLLLSKLVSIEPHMWPFLKMKLSLLIVPLTLGSASALTDPYRDWKRPGLGDGMISSYLGINLAKYH